ncbi:MAG: DUF3108 domain-containing protein, partial [Gammaproteobacteria bacterium]|nr:DUF3108 domain-containing protein [Gammaproteobacteria bacterium]
MNKAFISALAGIAFLTMPGFAIAQDATPIGPDIRVTARYSSSVLIFKVGEITLTAEVGAEGYSATTHIEAAGLAALFTDFDIDAGVSGTRTPAGLVPLDYHHVERTGHKVRRVEIDFHDPVATTNVEPPFGSLGVP